MSATHAHTLPTIHAPTAAATHGTTDEPTPAIAVAVIGIVVTVALVVIVAVAGGLDHKASTRLLITDHIRHSPVVHAAIPVPTTHAAAVQHDISIGATRR